MNYQTSQNYTLAPKQSVAAGAQLNASLDLSSYPGGGLVQVDITAVGALDNCTIQVFRVVGENRLADTVDSYSAGSGAIAAGATWRYSFPLEQGRYVVRVTNNDGADAAMIGLSCDQYNGYA